MIKVTRKIEFDAAHRVMNHENKCKYLHGHRYILEISFSSSGLDTLGRVIDFGIIKDRVKAWIDDNLDHTVILSVQDKALGDFIENYTGQVVYYIEANPTAENIASHLMKDVLQNLFSDMDVCISKIKLFETPNCWVKISAE